MYFGFQNQTEKVQRWLLCHVRHRVLQGDCPGKTNRWQFINSFLPPPSPFHFSLLQPPPPTFFFFFLFLPFFMIKETTMTFQLPENWQRCIKYVICASTPHLHNAHDCIITLKSLTCVRRPTRFHRLFLGMLSLNPVLLSIAICY